MIFTTSLDNSVYPDFTSFLYFLLFFLLYIYFFTILIWKKPLSFFFWITTCARQFPIHSFISFSQKSFEVEIIFSLQMRTLKLMRLMAWPTLDLTWLQSRLFFLLYPWLRSTQICPFSSHPKILRGKINYQRCMWIESAAVYIWFYIP